jgi:cytochrome c5
MNGVKFFVYKHIVDGVFHPEGVRANSADLDGRGERPVPQLCMVCHGGHYPGGSTTDAPPFNDVSQVKLFSEFIPFDLHNYGFAAAPFDKGTQQPAFKILNEQIVLATNPGPHTQAFIAEMYDGDNGVPPSTQEELLVITDPNGVTLPSDQWTAQASTQQMYKHVIGNACRTCHAAHPVPSRTFVNSKQVIDILGDRVEPLVCAQHVMPHASVTHTLFWQSVDNPLTGIIEPHQPGILQAFGDVFGGPTDWNGKLCGVYTDGLPTPPSAFGEIKSQIFSPICSGCHAGASPAGNLNLQAANAYAQLVVAGSGVDSCERPAMKRIKPGSAEDSYLFKKVQGTHGALSGCNVAPCNPFGGETGCGYQMPWTGGPVSNDPLTADQLDLLEGWIAVGAPE